MTLRTIAAISIAVLLSVGSAIEAQVPTGEQSKTPAPSYILKASPKWAKEIDEVLAIVAQKIQFMVPARFTPEAFLQNLCAAAVDESKVEIIKSQQQPGRVEVKMPPCVQIQRNVKVSVTAGDTLEGLAIVSGLPAGNADTYKVIPAEGKTAQTINPESLKIGDTVVFPAVPVWTNVIANPEVAADREAIVKAIARKLRCRSSDAEACLRQNGVELLNRAGAPTKPVIPKGFESSLLREVSIAAPQRTAQTLRMTSSAQPRLMSIEVASAAPPLPVAPAPPPPAPASAPPAAATVAAPALVAADTEPPPDATFPVAPEQWPYDVKLLAKILEEDGPQLLQTVIGIADGGLADRKGGPLSDSAYAPTLERKSLVEVPRDEPNNEDDDTNHFLDDLLGAGVNRPSVVALVGSGNVSLCESSHPDFKGWPMLASHGTAISAIAAARRVREADPKLGAFLPQLLFFRLVAEACDSQATFGVGDAEIRQGFDYLLAQHADIISISYKVDKALGDTLTPRIKEALPQKNILLFLPAGNLFVGDLDKKPPVCPACLGNAEHGLTAAKRTVVVGGATRDLHRATWSNFGPRTVSLFAPGDPLDAIDILGQPLPPSERATSYATPYAALAAAVIRSFGKPNDYSDVRDRLEAATWPLDDPNSDTAHNYVGVVDLLKAAAVKHNAVEVKEQEADGSWVRRTYIGKLSQPLKMLAFCQGNPFTENSYHAIRIGEPGEAGGRAVRLYPRAIDDTTQRREPVDFSNSCKPSGELRMKTITGEDKVFQLSRVTYVQATWW